ncbi:transmembrane proteins 14C-domain-containing protein [Mrakia frigida]|uniref:Tmh11p n=1 Tax=Mrakia frigida TaxID=29902 RepID=UPI003FCBEE66
MSHHPASTLSGLCFAGGIYGFTKTRSLPSLIGGFAIGSLYALSAMRIKEGLDYGYETAAGTSALLLAVSAPRFRKATAPKILSGLGVLGGGYYGKQVYDFRQ